MNRLTGLRCALLLSVLATHQSLPAAGVSAGGKALDMLPGDVDANGGVTTSDIFHVVSLCRHYESA